MNVFARLDCMTALSVGQADVCKLLSFAEITFRIRFLGAGRLPPFRGATIRGAIGFSLRRAVCHVRGGPCQQCPVVSSCAYSCLFEGVAPPGRQIMRKYANIPQPFTLIVNEHDLPDIAAGTEYSFSFRLFGQAITQLPYLAFALMQAGEQGLGKDKIPFEVIKVIQRRSDGQNKVLYDGVGPNISPPQPDALVIEKTCDIEPGGILTVAFETPVRYRFNGEFCYEAGFVPFLKAAMRRVQLMTHFYGLDVTDYCDPSELIGKSGAVEVLQDNTRRFGFERYSNRQKQRVPLVGMIGSVVYKGDFRPFYPILKLAELTHVGKATSFGFGRISLRTAS